MKTIPTITKRLMLVLALLLAVPAVAEQRRTVKIGYLPITHAYPLFTQQQLHSGDLSLSAIELVKFGSWAELSEALNAGKIDGASVLLPLAVKARENGIPIRAVALGHRDGNVFVVDPSINSASELRGKTLAIPSKLSAHYILLNLALRKAGLTLADVKVVELPPPEMPAALSEKRISGYLVAEPFGAKAVALGKGKVLFTSEQIWKDSLCCVLVLRLALIEKERPVAQEIVRSYLRAARDIDAHTPAALEAGKKYMKVEDKVLNLSLKWISYRNLIIGQREYDVFVRHLTDLGLSKNPPRYAEMVDASLARSGQ